MALDGSIRYIMDASGITGDSMLENYSNKVDISFYSYSAATPVDNLRGPGQTRTGVPHVSECMVLKKVCSATPKLESQFYTGKPIPTVTLYAFKMDGTKPSPFQIVTLTNVIISNYAATPDGEENFAVVFDSVAREIFTQDEQSGQMTSKGKTTFNLKTAKAS